MTSEQLIEEILFEAAAYGLRQEVIDTAFELRKQNPSISTLTSYELAYLDWVK